ncbi:hypothetical protein PTSG_00647 [Salpingoeca rosetta]|uniref:Uncharacterized protein n=1 Tax=Salpingoeca rosetta (strain ATCC 50818 / BSB-021) TaxID=946362 RepID=F2TX31_SALR5|nr:uncharacterized protein PTSG_00647 [Salpingoeca rosetta]EGD75940.1 hypothetical protein PTSG_00647 [Salpingoeca rosetta]|eukprot:XP_004998116.1 hypothetical protein PTSG_00647 [Salpingoeca rosetta]
MRGGWRGLLSHVKRLDTKDRVTKRDVEDVLRACQAIGRQEGAMEDVIYHMCTAFASSSKLKRKMPETCHFLLPASDTTATTICANARAAPEVQAIITALNATDGSDDDVMAALETWTVASLGFNALSETLTACPQNSLPSAAFWIAILSQEDALEDVLWRCDRWAAVLRRVSKFEASQDAALAVIGAMLSSKFSTIATLTRHLMRERIFSPVSLVKYYTSLPRAFISSRTFPLVQEAVRACQPDAGFSEEVERVLQTVVSKLSQQINTEDSETCAQLLCQRFRSFFDEFVAGCTRQEIQGVMADIDFVSTIPCVTELAQTISSVLEDEDDGDDL